MEIQDSLTTRLKNSWNAFWGRDPTKPDVLTDYGPSYGSRPDKQVLTGGNERSVVASIYNRIAVDCASIRIEHARRNEDGNFLETIDSSLNECLTLDANTDQTSFDFMMDVVLSMFDEGHVVILPVDADVNLKTKQIFDIYSMRTGRVVQWFPNDVKVKCFNKEKQSYDEIIVPKKMVAIIQNPFYSVMNEPNATVKRLIRTLNNLDKVNRDNASGKLDLIIQLPYSTSNPKRRQQAEKRRRDLERQLAGSKYGVAYADGTERIVQLNRAIENNMWNESKELLAQVYAQLSMSENIMNGTATEQEVLFYYDHTIDPIMNAIALEMTRKFLSKTARTQRQYIYYFRDPFKLVPAKEIAAIAQIFTANEILSSNEIRAELGYKPVDDPRADQLINSNINPASEEMAMPPEEEIQDDGAEESSANGSGGDPIDVGRQRVEELMGR